MRIGSRTLRNNLFVAPMAGVTDRPFRQLCKQFGAGLAVSEMVASNSLLWGSEKTRRRANHDGEVEPISVQIAGADPAMMADAARYNVEQGAQIIDINMGCPAKKVCNAMAGSALLRDEPLVRQILESVVKAVDVPVTLKFRTGWDTASKKALDAPPGDRQRRHHHARGGQAGSRIHRRGRDYGRPGGTGSSLDLPRDRALSGDRREASPASGERDPHGAYRPPARPLLVLRRRERRQSRSQAYLLVYEGARRVGELPPPHEPARELRRAAGRGQRFL